MNLKPVLGLALGGGGARGLAHIGVLMILEQAGILPDVVSGTSMGGMIAAAYAAGVPPAQLEGLAVRTRLLRWWLPLVRPAPTRGGVFDPARLEDFFLGVLGEDLDFSELKRPLGLTAVDLDRGEDVVLTSGRVLDAVRATIALPGLFPPAEWHGRRLVDGGVLNNVPADVARRLGGQVVIAVDVGHQPRWGEPWTGPEVRPPLASLLPRMALDFYQTEMIMVTAITSARLEKARPEVLIRPEIRPAVTILSGFAHAEEIIAAGEQAARAALPAIRAAVRPSWRWWLARRARAFNQAS